MLLGVLASPSWANLNGPGPKVHPLPKGLTIVDWSQIRGEYERHRHGSFPEPGGFQARGFHQRWMTHFDGRGFSVVPDEGAWRFGLELAGVRGKARVTTDVNRVTYHWSAKLDEWFVNGVDGLEQGFTLKSPMGVSGIELSLRVRGGMRPSRTADGIAFLDATGAAQVNYTGLKALDASGRKLSASMQIRGGQVVLHVDDRGAKYPVTVDPLIAPVQQAYVKASNTGELNKFGGAVAISGDIVVVGAAYESSNATGVNGNQANETGDYGSGAAYVFVRSGGTWTQQAYLKASTVGAYLFGSSVAVSGDTVAIGAPYESNRSAFAFGAAYVFTRSGTVWTQQAYLAASNAGGADLFGSSVAISGNTIVVGAPGEASTATGVNGNQTNNSAAQSGAAYVFVRSGAAWTQQAYLKASNTGTGDKFGYSVGVSEDSILVGAAAESSNATGVNGNQADNSLMSAGAAYVFVRSGGVWTQQAYLKASNTGAGDAFGFSVGLSGNTAVVAAPNEASNATGINGNQGNNSTPGSGAAYAFVRSGSNWTQQAYLKASNAEAEDLFGYSAAISGDVIVVGAYLEDSNGGVNGNQGNDNGLGSDSGAAYGFVRTGSTWTQQAYLKASNLGPLFGFSVAISGETVVVGAPAEEGRSTGVNGDQTTQNGLVEAGAAYVFASSAGGVTVNTSPQGLLFSASGTGCAPGTSYMAPQVLAWTPGSACTLSVSSPQTGLRFDRWEDNSTNPVRSLTAPTAGAVYTAVFVATTAVPALTSISPNPALTGTNTFTLTGTNFDPATALVEITGGPTVANSSLTTKTATTLAFSRTFAAGSYSILVRNGAGGTASNALTLTVTSTVPTGSHFVPITPCRSIDTRQTTAIPGVTFRDFSFGACNIPANATAVALNITLVPNGQFGYLSVWPAGQAQPVVSTMNSLDGRIKANAAIVGLGTNKAVSIFVTETAHVILDVNGYFVPAGTPGALAFYPVTPCRVVDTRNTGGIIPAQGTRKIDGGGSCLPASAQAYSLNVTVVPPTPLGFLTLFPEGLTRPLASTLNAVTGTVVANAAILKSGTGGAFNAYVTEQSHAIIDLNGYFAAPGQPGALAFYPLQPCRIFDTRNANGAFGGPRLNADSTRDFTVPSSACNVPATAQAYVMNATMVPPGVFGFLTLFPSGVTRPTVSTLNAIDGALTSNAALLPAGPGGVIRVYTSDATHMLLDVSGYFAP
jgi:hypothetical protein